MRPQGVPLPHGMGTGAAGGPRRGHHLKASPRHRKGKSRVLGGPGRTAAGPAWALEAVAGLGRCGFGMSKEMCLKSMIGSEGQGDP